MDPVTTSATIQRVVIIVGVVATLIGVMTGLAGTFYLRLKDRREAKAQKNDDVETMISVKDATIDALKEQYALMVSTMEEERKEARAAAERMRIREEKMEARLSELERDYRNLVLTVTTMSFCANAGTCPNNDPGDRRKKAQT